MLRRVAPFVVVSCCLLATTSTRADPPEGASSAPAPGRGVVEGRVTDVNGAPASGVAVSLVARPRRGTTVVRDTRTGRDGRYRFEDVAPADVSTFVADRGLVARGIADFLAVDAGPLGRALRAGMTTSINLVVERGARIVGRVLSESGKPVQRVLVEARPADDRRGTSPFAPPAVSATTDDEGRVVLDGLVPGLAYDVVVLLEGAPPLQRPRVTPGGAAVAPIEIRLPEPREVWLDVTENGATTRPLRDVRVRVTSEHPAFRAGPGLEVRTNSQGRVRLLVPIGAEATVRVEATGWLRVSNLALPKDAGEAVVRLERAQTISGLVLEPDGSPAADVEVGVVLSLFSHDARTARSGADGRFVVEGVPAGRQLVVAGVERTDEVTLEAMSSVEAGASDVVLRLKRVGKPPGASIRVQALGPEGEHVSRAAVVLRTAKGGSIYRSLVHGSATLTLGDMLADHRFEGAFVVVADAEDENGAALPYGPAVVGPLLADVSRLEVRLPAERILTGSVHGPEGEPVVGARVYLGMPKFDGDDVRSCLQVGSRAGVWCFERTDENGAFRCHGLPEEAMAVHVEPPLPYRSDRETPIAVGAKHVDVVVETADRAEVTAVDPDGAPVVGAEVSAVADGGRNATGAARTDSRGVALLTGVRPRQRYVLKVDASREFLVFTQADWTPLPTTVRLERARSIAGVVRAPDGTPIAKTFVKHDDPGTEWWARSQSTDKQGRFRFDRLPPGPLTLSAELGDSLFGAEAVPGPVTLRTVRVEAGAQGIVILLDPGRRLEVVPPTDTPDGTDIFISCTRGTHVFGGVRRTSRSERHFVGGLLSDDRLTFFMLPDTAGRSVAQEAAPADSPIRLARCVEGTIRGRVVLPEGVVSASVRAMEERLDFAIDAQTDAAGRYEIRGVPEGWTWTLNAWSKPPGAKHEGALQHVRRGEAPDLVLKPVHDR